MFCQQTLVCIIAGDLNSRTAENEDFCENISDSEALYIPLPTDNFENDIPMRTRCSQDKGMNGNGAELLQFCKFSEFRILNGRTGKDNGIGKFTYVCSSGRSVVDYVLCKQCDFSYISGFEVLPETIYSDHCQLKLSMKFKMTKKSIPKNNMCKSRILRWDNSEQADYRDKLSKIEVVFVKNV